MITATSTRCTLQLHDLGLVLLADVPTPIPASAAAEVEKIPGVVVVETDPAPATAPEEN
jgi:hypothetical protein